MNCSKRTKGAVSVFLVMILVPCIVVTSVFVDLGRVHMSKSMAASASDLALNSLLTNYDADLKEWYGIVASCQNVDEFYQASAQLFLRTLSSQGLSDDEIVLLSDYYANVTNDDKIFDLLQVECQTAPSEMVGAVSGANLTNATMIKDSVVEFMKYRAPIELTSTIIERLNSDSTVMEAVEADENKELVDDKTEYYQAEGELLAAAFNSYIAIYDYVKEAEYRNLNNDKLNEYANKLTTYKNAYSDIHRMMVSNLYNTSGLSVYSRVTLSLDAYKTTYTEKSNKVYSRKETSDGTTHYYIDGSRITALIEELETNIGKFEQAIDNYYNAAKSYMNNQPGSGDNQPYVIQWWVKLSNAVNATSGTNYTEKVKSAGQEMLKSYAKVLAISKCELGNDIPDNWEEDATELENQVSDLQSKYLKANVADNSDNYLKTVKKLEDVSKNNINNISSASVTVSIDGQTKTIDQAIPYLQSRLTSIRGDLQSCVDLLNIAIDGNESDKNVADADKVKSLDGLLSLVKKYRNSLNTWSNTADSTSTKMGEENRSEISEINSLCENITESAVTALKSRLVNIRSQIQSLITAIDGMKYGGTSVREISSYSTFKSKASSKVSESGIGLKNKEIKDYSSTTFSQLFEPSSSSVITLSHLTDSNYNLLINPISKQVATPELFIYFQKKFGGLSKQDVQSKQDELDGGKDEGSNQEKAAKEKGRYHGGGSEITRDFSKDGTFNLADGVISGFTDLIDSLVNLNINSIRDDLYVTSYIMNMFSYATYEEEGIYKLVENKTELYLPSSGHTPTQYSNYIGSATTEHSWLSEKLTDSYNKSLTNKLINKENNSAYGAEVEYILYGGREGKVNADNVKSVYDNIYGIRYVLNLISAFKNFWSMGNPTADAIEAVARVIQLATGGIIPAELTKVVLLPILTIFETSKDLDRLEAGMPVELFKSTLTQWWIRVPDGQSAGSVDGLTSIFKGAFNGPNTDKGLFYSDYLTIFVYLGLKSSAGEAMYQRMAEVIQANMRKLTKQTTYSMSKSQLYFKLSATIRVKPLMITLPYFKEYENHMDTKTDWCTYTINTTRGY